MEGSFSDRGGKAFGSLSSLSCATSESLNSLWSVTDDKVGKREGNRDKGSPEPRDENELEDNFQQKKAIDYREELEKDLDDLDDQDEEEETACASSSSRKDGKPDDYNDEEWEVKSSIGRDCTLDYEEEEDEYDIVAIGREKAGDHHVYMKDGNGYDVDAYDNELMDFSRDPRANHIAAKLRLKEDAEAAKKMVEEDTEVSKKIDLLRMSVEDGSLKSILKRKCTESDPKPQKRVRFEEEAMVCHEVSTLSEAYPYGVPDYMRNPWKYTHYAFDSGDDDDDDDDDDDESNIQARMGRTETQADDGLCDLTKPEESCSESKKIEDDEPQSIVDKRTVEFHD